jgi:hypothetical protein
MSAIHGRRPIQASSDTSGQMQPMDSILWIRAAKTSQIIFAPNWPPIPNAQRHMRPSRYRTAEEGNLCGGRTVTGSCAFTWAGTITRSQPLRHAMEF